MCIRDSSPATAPVAVANPKSSVSHAVRDRAAEAAAVTLTALLPRLAASDTLPLLDRSATLAGDLSRLLSSYDPVSYTHLDVYKRQP